MNDETVFNKLLRRGFWLGVSGLILTLVGCGGSHDNGHKEHEHEGHEHVHHAPHGGALTMLGDHAFQVEILPDPSDEQMDLYILDGEAGRFVRIAAPVLQGVAKAGERQWELRFQAVANDATGETVGNSSHFTASATELLNVNEFEVIFGRLEILGQVFEDVRVLYPEGSHGE